MSNSVWPHRRQPTSLPRPWDSPGKNTGVGCHFLLQCRKVKSKSEVAQSLFATPCTAAYQAPPSMGFSRQEYGVGCKKERFGHRHAHTRRMPCEHQGRNEVMQLQAKGHQKVSANHQEPQERPGTDVPRQLSEGVTPPLSDLKHPASRTVK